MSPATPRSVFVHRNPPNRSGINKPWWWFFDRNYPNWTILLSPFRDVVPERSTLTTPRLLALHNPVSDALRLPTKELFQLYNSCRLGLVRQPPSYHSSSSMKVKQTKHRRVRGTEQLLNKDEETDIPRKSVCDNVSKIMNSLKVDPNFNLPLSVIRMIGLS